MSTNQYQEMRNRQQAEINAFPMFFAFNKQQFAEGMRTLGLIFTKLIWQSACIFPNRFFSSDMEIGENRMYPDYYICFFIQPLHRDITAYHKGWWV